MDSNRKHAKLRYAACDRRSVIKFLDMENLWNYITSYNIRGVGGSMASESALRSAVTRPLCRGFEPRHGRPGLAEGLKVCDNLVVGWLYTKTKSIRQCTDFVTTELDLT
ncbi:hypothetical protein PoB_002781200 [Plakobranchus ocellatus]|uniref:Uncharacterized protein n=1 Tax=Plakobranchus ocellatus TaxID=259542 RepID=A0AAV4A351_9GAST|nr:hypothetical protein PoB_002781200 [Plakobranchus ocellatus]